MVSEAPGVRDDGPRPPRPDGSPSAVVPAASASPVPRVSPEAAPADGGRPSRESLDAQPMNGPADRPIGAVLNGSMPGGPPQAGCTAPQLRRFIKSRPYVPMHELRRRFGINGGEDDVSAIDLGGHRVFVGLPAREGSLLGELLRGGDIGYELSLDPRTPVVVGLYPMRPVARS
jgi:hypothetical protein